MERVITVMKTSWFRLVSALAFALALASLAVAQSNVGDNETTQSNSGASIDDHSTKSAGIRIGHGDLLEMKVFDVPELTQALRIDDNGKTEIALLGSLQLAGLTTGEAQAFIEKKLRDSQFIIDPHVSLLIREYGTQGVSVVGEIKKPGIYPVLGSRNLLDIIAQAGGITPFAAHKALIQRRDSTQDKIEVSLSNDASELVSGNVELRPGDTIIVPKAGEMYVIGEIEGTGGCVMKNDGRLTLLQAVALAAGVNRTASSGKTRIIRKTPTGFEEAKVDLKRVLAGKTADLALKAEDIVYIPPSNAKSILMRAPSVMQSAASAAVYQSIP